MRYKLGLTLASIAALAAMNACTVKDTNTDTPIQTGGSAGASGTAGTSGGGSAGDAGSAGGDQCIQEQTGTDCGTVTANGSCVCGQNKLQFCLSPPPGSEEPAKLQTTTCPEFTQCQITAKGIAECVDSRACKPGDTACSGDKLATCRADGSGWDESDCAAFTKCGTPPGQPSKCIDALSNSGTDQFTLTGKVNYETKGFSTQDGIVGPVTDGARREFIAVYEGDEYIGSAITGGDGSFNAKLTKAATANTTVFVYALDFFPDSQQPLIAVVRGDPNAPDLKSQQSDDYWFWSNKGDPNCGLQAASVTPDANGAGQATMADLTIPIACGSGAIRIFQWIRFHLTLLGPTEGVVAETKDKKQDSLMIVWEPGKDAFCGACFAGRQFGGGVVKPKGTTTVDNYDTMIYISGTNANPTEWADSVNGHESGHYTMATYSVSPGEGGVHYVSQASKPGLSYSEAHATASGQWLLSDPANNDYDPVYKDVQDGTMFWVNIETAMYKDTKSLEKPDPNGPIDQNINENLVAGMLWHMWHPPHANSANGPYQGIGDSGYFKNITSARLTQQQYNRGYQKFDLVDFLDGTICNGIAQDSQVKAVANHFSFPWDSSPKCPN